MCVYLSVCYMCVCVCICFCVCTCVWVYVCAFMCLCVFLCVYVVVLCHTEILFVTFKSCHETGVRMRVVQCGSFYRKNVNINPRLVNSDSSLTIVACFPFVWDWGGGIGSL